MLNRTDKETFHAIILKNERNHNAGCTTEYNEGFDTTAWYIAGHLIGVTTGKIGESSNYALTMYAIGLESEQAIPERQQTASPLIAGFSTSMLRIAAI